MEEAKEYKVMVELNGSILVEEEGLETFQDAQDIFECRQRQYPSATVEMWVLFESGNSKLLFVE
jgi:hypothetical protein